MYDVLTSKNTLVKVFKSSINFTNFSLLFKIPPLPEGIRAVIGHNFETYRAYTKLGNSVFVEKVFKYAQVVTFIANMA